MLLGFPEYQNPARALASALGIPFAMINVHRFPDGESKLTLPDQLAAHVVFCRSLHQPNDKLIELLLAAKTARELGAKRLTLVAPYLCYMRQDIAFNPGETVSQKIVGNFLAALFDDVITVDPHLHRIDTLAEAVPASNSIALSAAPAMSAFLGNKNQPLLIGPDSESQQWVEDIAQRGGHDFGVASKTRLGDREVIIKLPDINLQNRSIVLVDDVISSGETMAITAEECLAAGAREVDVLATHPLFAVGAEQRLREAGVTNIWSSDSIPHPSNAISLCEILAEAVGTLN